MKHLLILLFLYIFNFYPSKSLGAQQKQSSGSKILSNAVVASDRYVHKWIKFPKIKGSSLGGEDVEYTGIKGQVEVLVFIGSSCIPCQHLIRPLQKIKREFGKLDTSFTYIFTHDTLSDARAFVKVHALENDRTMIAGHSILESYNNPMTPTIYLADRNNWLIYRWQKADGKSLKKLKKVLRFLTAI